MEISDEKEIKINNRPSIAPVVDEPDDYVKCCGCKYSKYCLNFSVRFFITLLIIGFSFYKLITEDDCSTEAVYISLITSLISFWIGYNISTAT